MPLARLSRWGYPGHLPKLGRRLKLPGGWEFKAEKLDRNPAITTSGLAHTVPSYLDIVLEDNTP